MKNSCVRLFLVPLAVCPSLLRAQSPPTTYAYTVPGIAKVAGKNGTHFVSDAVIANPGSAPALVTYGFAPPIGSAPSPAFLAPGQSVPVRDVVATLFGASESSGALTVSSSQPLVIRARTYNDAASGTFGVALPVYDTSGFLSAGGVGHSLWVSQSSDPNSGFRTNVTVVFPDPDGGSATVTVYDGNGSQIGQSDFSLGSAGVQQISIGKFSSAADVARATIQVTSGRAAGYSSVVDNVTGDSSLFTFDDLPAGPQDVLINGVARANGKENTFFRTDGRFFNPGTQDVVVTAAFHANATSNPAPVQATFTVPAGKILDATDLLGTILAQPVGSSGAIRFTSNSPVGVLCRTSNVDPTGARPGTFGAQQKPVPTLSFLMSADAGALVTGVRQSPDPATGYRTNIALAAGSDGATAQFTLRTAAGVAAGTATQTLGPWGWKQTAVDKLFPGTTTPENAEVLVKITQGSADVFDSSVDNGSGDSVVTPAPPLPASIPTSATVGPAGGSIQSDDGRLTLKIPAGAVASPTAFSIVTGANGAPNGVGSGYTISRNGVILTKPALLELHYAASDTLGSDVSVLGLAYLSGSTWFGAPGARIDTARRTLTVPIGATAPAPTLRSALSVLDASSVQWSPFVRFQIVPKQVFLFPSGHSPFALQAVAASDAGSNPVVLGPPSAPGGLDLNWYVNGKLDVLASDGTVQRNTDGTRATYTAPSCLPLLDPVTVAVQIIDRTDRSNQKFVSAKAYVIARDWKINVDWFWKKTCAGTLVTWAYGGTQDVLFNLNDQFQIINSDSLTATPTRIEPTACPGYQTICTGKLTMGAFQTIRNSTVTGGLSTSDGVLHAVVHYTEPDLPDVRQTGCPGPVGYVPFSGFEAGKVVEHEALFSLDRYPVLKASEDASTLLVQFEVDYTATEKTPRCH